MTDDFRNVYQDPQRAASYAKLEFPGTYYLAYRDLPELIAKYVRGRRAMDFGCGTGRSTRFLARLGFAAVGVDISEDMIRLAQASDPEGDYRLIGDGDFGPFTGESFDLILSVFTFDNIPTRERKVSLFKSLGALLSPDGCLISVVSSPEIYVHEWASFTTRAFPANRTAQSGDRVKIIMTDVDDRRPVEDILCTDASYGEIYGDAALVLLETRQPLGHPEEPYAWVNETTVAPWTIYVLAAQGRAAQC